MFENRTPRILVAAVDDKPIKHLESVLSGDFEVLPALDRSTMIDIAENEDVLVAVLTSGTSKHYARGEDKQRTIDELMAVNPGLKTVILFGEAERDTAMLSLGNGVHDVLPSSAEARELREAVRRLYRLAQREHESIEEQALSERLPADRLIGSSKVMKTVMAEAARVASSQRPVLILGEDGTEKELFARALHAVSPRKRESFRSIHCGVVPERLIEDELAAIRGLLEPSTASAARVATGTLFLDSVGELSPALQAGLWTFVKESVSEHNPTQSPGTPRCQIIAAAPQEDLAVAVSSGQFHKELYLGLSGLRIVLPPLRQREDDVIELAKHLATSLSRELRLPPKRFSQASLRTMRDYAWPGNLRELQSVVRRALVLAEGPVISPEDLAIDRQHAEDVRSRGTLREAREQFERRIVSNKLMETGGNISKAARALGISRPTMYELIARYKLGVQPSRGMYTQLQRPWPGAKT